MWRSILIVTLIFLLSPMSGLAFADSPPYKIGAILPLSGDVASLGVYVRKGIELAYKNLPPEQQKTVQIFYEDDQFQSQKSVSAFHKLMSTEKVDAIFVVGSSAGNSVAPLAEKAGKLFIAIGASDAKIARGKKYVFTHWVSPDAEAKVLVEEVKRRGLKRVGILSHEQEGAIALEEAFVRQMNEQGLKENLVYQERVTQDMKDFRSVITKMRAKKLDGLCTGILSGGLAAFAKQARDQHLGAQIFGFEIFEDENEVKASDGALIGSWFANADDFKAGFQQQYQETYHEYPGWGTGNAYDALNLVADAVKENGHDNKEISEALRAVKDYCGAVGTYSASGDNRFTLPATLKVVEKTGFKKLSE